MNDTFIDCPPTPPESRSPQAYFGEPDDIVPRNDRKRRSSGQKIVTLVEVKEFSDRNRQKSLYDILKSQEDRQNNTQSRDEKFLFKPDAARALKAIFEKSKSPEQRSQRKKVVRKDSSKKVQNIDRPPPVKKLKNSEWKRLSDESDMEDDNVKSETSETSNRSASSSDTYASFS